MNGRKMSSVALLVALVLTPALAAAPLPGPKKATPEDIAKAEAAVKAALAGFKSEGGRVTHIKDDAVEKALPGKIVFAVLWRRYLGPAPPTGLSTSNVFVVDSQGKVTPLINAAALQKYLKEAVAPVTDDAAARDAVHACARLGYEMAQDGYYKFQVVDEAIKVEPARDGGRTAAVRTAVVEGGDGEISLLLKFDDVGKLTGLEERVKVRPGVRPVF
jgi:hypothetical protein